MTRLVRLYATSRRLPTALLLLLAFSAGLRVALHWRWDAYGALQLPLLFETAATTLIAVSVGSPFGEPERATGRRLPALRLGMTTALTALTVGVLAAAGARGFAAVRDVAGLTGVGLLAAAVVGAGLAWAATTGYMVIALFAQYTRWHGPAITTPWIWPARPPHDVGAALCAGLVFAAGLAVITVRGARDRG